MIGSFFSERQRRRHDRRRETMDAQAIRKVAYFRMF